MKKINLWEVPLYIFVGLFGLNQIGCSDFLEEKNEQEYTMDGFYQTVDQLEQAANGLQWTLYRLGSTEEYLQITEGIPGYFCPTNDGRAYSYSTLKFTPEEEWVSRFWQFFYEGTIHSTAIINNGNNLNVSAEEEAKKKRVLGEAHFFRGYFYFFLLQMYGEEIGLRDDVPISVEDAKTMQAKPGEVYHFIISDLEKAIDYLPEGPGYSKGRPEKQLAKALLGQVYLRRAWSKSKESDDFTKAAKYSGEVIINGMNKLFCGVNEYKKAGKYQKFMKPIDVSDLSDRMQPGSRFPGLDATHSIKFERKIESMFASQFVTNGSDAMNEGCKMTIISLPYIYAGSTKTAPEICLEIAGGKTNPNGAWSNRSMWPLNSVISIDSLQDIRFKNRGFFCYDYPTFDGKFCYLGIEAGETPKATVFRYFDEGHVFDWGTAGANAGDKSRSTDITLLRYAEVLLDYAEAVSKGGTPIAGITGEEALNAVRVRAGLTEIPLNLENVVLERFKETVYEGKTLWNLSRTHYGVNVYPQKNGFSKLEVVPLEKFIRPSSIDDTHFTNADSPKNMPEKNLYLPIPTTEILQNPNMTQNPLWEN